MSVSADTRTILLPRPSIAQRRITLCGSLAFCLVISVIFSAAHGPANIPYGNVARLLLRGPNFPIGLEYVRIVTRRPEENERLLSAIAQRQCADPTSR